MWYLVFTLEWTVAVGGNGLENSRWASRECGWGTVDEPKSLTGPYFVRFFFPSPSLPQLFSWLPRPWVLWKTRSHSIFLPSSVNESAYGSRKRDRETKQKSQGGASHSHLQRSLLFARSEGARLPEQQSDWRTRQGRWASNSRWKIWSC